MISSVFKKSTPLNLILVVILILVFFLLYQFQDFSWINSSFLIFNKAVLFIVLLASVFIINFIVKRNGMSKDSSYTIFFYFLFLLFFPSLFNNINLIASNFFILLALRRLISLQSLKASKEKIFDASLWIFVAALFQFWSILYILLVFISILFLVSKDYRNWFLPFIALFAVSVVFVLFSIISDIKLLEFFKTNIKTSYEINYFTNNYQNGALSIYATVALFFLISMFVSLSNKPLIVHTSFKKIITSFFIGIAIFLISANKSNDLLVFTIAPLAIMATSHIEAKQLKLKQEMVLFVLIACSLFAFFSQL
jgi:hypothetical protein